MEMKFNLRLINIPTICFGEFAIVDVRSMKWKIILKYLYLYFIANKRIICYNIE